MFIYPELMAINVPSVSGEITFLLSSASRFKTADYCQLYEFNTLWEELRTGQYKNYINAGNRSSNPEVLYRSFPDLVHLLLTLISEMNKYPLLINLANNLTVLLRPANEDDFPGIEKLLTSIPLHEKIIYKDDVQAGEKIESWFLNPQYHKNVHLVALHNSMVVAEGTLHSKGLYWSGAAEIKLIVHPDYRNMGIGRKMFKTLLYEGFSNKFQKIIVRFRADSEGFQKILRQFEFTPETSLKYYVEDEVTRRRKDLVIASFDLASWTRRFEYYRIIFNM